MISSFDHLVVKKIRELDQEIKTGLLVYGRLIAPVEYMKQHHLHVFSIHPSAEHITADFVDEMHRFGISVYTYTVNERWAWKRCLESHVDGIFTDYPDRFAT